MDTSGASSGLVRSRDRLNKVLQLAFAGLQGVPVQLRAYLSKERFEVACFIYVNGVNPEVYFDWAKLIGNIHANNTKGWKDIRALFSKFDETESPVLGKYWAFDVVNNRYEYLNGITRYY